ncbi:phospholipase, patatin family [Oesophagostomum dentatum]|uniref:Phospholipase, patatin family n=1 Tax=Oesophagostomum dentatum TaxID=61180 RepID=A0A0B1S5I5_OESDE|nr:phospholipase, patatin family [Oesophagostomum dentatum]
MKAVQVANLDLVKLLLLFEADLKAVDAQGQSVYEINKSSKRRADIDLLLAVMDPPASAASPQAKTPWDYQQEMAIKAQKESNEANGERVNLLSLDGGGIRGLVVIQVLSELEKKLGADFLSHFGWLGGTSTGAILALALSQGKSIAYCRAMYFRLKDELFCGKRPYSSTLLDSFLRSEFGEDTTMADVKGKK